MCTSTCLGLWSIRILKYIMATNIIIIDENDCIGDSLEDINNNFSALSILINNIKNLDTTSIETLSADLVNLKNTLNA